jgi:hypothetical protein
MSTSVTRRAWVCGALATAALPRTAFAQTVYLRKAVRVVVNRPGF